MKKYILLIVLVLLFARVDVFATDACDKLIPQYASFVGKATFGSNLRDYPCVSKSNVLGVSKVGALYTIISKVDGWYQIKDDNGKIYRIRDQSIVRTDNTVSTSNIEPVYTESIKSTGYKLTFYDNRIINKFVYKMTKIINDRGEEYKDLLISAIYELIDEYSHLDRLVAILEEIITKLTTTVVEENNPVNYDYNSVNTSSSINTYNLKNIDISKVKNTWMGWYNDVRKDLGRKSYIYNAKLESTALDWSKVSKTRGYMDHRRSLGDAYYDYNKITSWFSDRGVVCKNIYGVTHTENIGYGSFSCSDGECTDELIKGIRSTFDFFYNEKYKDYQAHYLSIINKYFTGIGLGIELEDKGNGYYKYYLTVHYCTEVLD